MGKKSSSNGTIEKKWPSRIGTTTPTVHQHLFGLDNLLLLLVVAVFAIIIIIYETFIGLFVTMSSSNLLKPGQRFPTPTPGFGDRVFYESLLRQRPNSEMAQDWCLHYGILAPKKAQKLLDIVTERRKRQRTGESTTNSVGSSKKKKIGSSTKVKAEEVTSSSSKVKAEKVTSSSDKVKSEMVTSATL